MSNQFPGGGPKAPATPGLGKTMTLEQAADAQRMLQDAIAKQKAEQAGQAAAQPPAFGAPAAPAFPPQPTPDAAPAYGQPPAQPPAYGQPPQAPAYGQPPQAPAYGQPPQAPGYGQPPAPPDPNFGAPPPFGGAPGFGAQPPVPGAYPGAPPPAFGTPAPQGPGFGAPQHGAPSYGAAGSLGAPAPDAMSAFASGGDDDISAPPGATTQTLNLDFRIASAVGYFIGILAVIFLIAEPKQHRFVRFHALQGLLTWVLFIVANIVLTIISVIASMISGLLGTLVSLGSLLVFLGTFVHVIMAAVKAYGGAAWKIPVVGNLAAKYSRP